MNKTKPSAVRIEVVINDMTFVSTRVRCDTVDATRIGQHVAFRIASDYDMKITSSEIKVTNSTRVVVRLEADFTKGTMLMVMHLLVPSARTINREIKTYVLSGTSVDAKPIKLPVSNVRARGRHKAEFTDAGLKDIIEKTAKNSSPRKSTKARAPERKHRKLISNKEKLLWVRLIRHGASVGSVALFFNVTPAAIVSTLRGYRWNDAVNHQSEIAEALRARESMKKIFEYTEDQRAELLALLDEDGMSGPEYRRACVKAFKHRFTVAQARKMQAEGYMIEGNST